MSRLIFDLEANGLNELVLDRKGVPRPEADRIHVLVTKDIDTGSVEVYRENDVNDGVRALCNADIIIGHNIILYDIPILERGTHRIPTKVYDTLIISRMMFPDKADHPLGGNSLKAWGEYLGEYKTDYQGGWEAWSQEMEDYCIQDVHVSERIFRYQLDFIKKNEKPVRLEHMVTNIIADQIENGFGFNLEAAQSLEQELMYEKASIEDQMRSIFPDKIHVRYSDKTGKRLKDKVEVFNPGSRQQIGDRLIEKYNWEPPTTDKGNYNIDAQVLKALDFPEAKQLCTYFDTTKLMSQVSDWVTRASHSRDGRIHGSLNPQGTVTGRMTASQPNLQQVSGDARARALFRPRDGWKQVGIDASGLEARLLASRMAEFDGGDYADVILNGDIHTTNQEAAGLSTRDQAKTFFYGFIYGAGNKKIGEIVGKGESVGAKLKKKFLAELPALKKVMDRARVSADSRKAVTLLDGRSVPVRSAHKALNTQIQGDGAIVMKLAQCILNEKIKENGLADKAKFMATVHDEWQLECDPSVAEQVGKLGVTSITEAGERLGCRMRLDGEFKIGENWSECH